MLPLRQEKRDVGVAPPFVPISTLTCQDQVKGVLDCSIKPLPWQVRGRLLPYHNKVRIVVEW
jgi:hypothetical protein